MIPMLDEKTIRFEGILDEAYAAAKAAVAGMPDRPLCGFAWVTIDGREPLAYHCRDRSRSKKFAMDTSAARRRYGRKGEPAGWQFWNPGFFAGQSIDAKEAGARAFREVLAKYGINATCGSRLD